VVSHNNTPFITIYNRSGDTFTKLANPATLPASTSNGVAWNHDGSSLAVAHATSPFITIYNRSGDTFTKLANPETLPPNTVNDVAWSPDGSKLAVAHSTSPFITVYNRSGDTLTKLANPAVLPPSTGNDVAWSADGTLLLVGHNNAPYLTLYRLSGSTLTRVDPSELPTDNGVSASFDAADRYLAVSAADNLIRILRRNDAVFRRMGGEPDEPNAIIGAVAFGEKFLAVSSLSGSPSFALYEIQEALLTATLAPATASFAGKGEMAAVLADAQAQFKPPSIMRAELDDATALFTGSGLFAAYLGAATSEINGKGALVASTAPATAYMPGKGALAASLSMTSAAMQGAGQIAASLAPAAADIDGAGRIASVLAAASGRWKAITFWLRTALDGVHVIDATAVDHAWRLRDGASLTEQTQTVGSFVSSVVDQIIAADKLAIVRDFLLSEQITITDLLDEQRRPVAVVVDAMVATDVAASVHQAVMLLASALALNESAAAALTFSVADALQIDDAVARALAQNAWLLSSALLSSALDSALTGTAVLIDTPQLDESLHGSLTGTHAIADAVQADAVLLLEGIPYEAWVVNTESGAPSEYRNWNFDSMCRLGDRYYGASESGLFRLDGDDDAGDPIEASVRTGDLDFGSPNIKRPLTAHIGYTAAGDMVLKVTVTHEGKRSEFWYRCKNPVRGTATEAKLPLGRGLASRRWQFELVNTAGADFDFESITLQMLELGRRL
jgi:hypothetical protein